MSPRLRRALPPVLVGVLVLAAAAFGLTALLGSSGTPAARTTAGGLPSRPVPATPRSFPTPRAVPTTPRAVPTTPRAFPTTPNPVPTTPNPTPPTATAAPTPTPVARPVYWLGMELETIPPGAAVVETVALGSAADRAGLEPGDAILEINNRPISGTSQIAAAIRGLSAGDVVSVQITSGSSVFGTQITLGSPPSAHP